MRRALIACLLVLSPGLAPSPADEPRRVDRSPQLVGAPVEAVLREASAVALKQPAHQGYWTQSALLCIGRLQMQACDFDGALRSMRASTYPVGRDGALTDLAEAMARAGNLDGALEILRLIYVDWRNDSTAGKVRLRWIDHLIAEGDLERAGATVTQLTCDRCRAAGLRALAAGHAKAGDSGRAANLFARSIEVAAGLKGESARARATLDVAGAQLAVCQPKAAMATVRCLVDDNALRDPWVEFTALLEAAVVAAKAKDDVAARKLFARALVARGSVTGFGPAILLRQIAETQARVGYVVDALETAWLIPHSEEDFSQDGEREEALYAVAVAQLAAGDAASARRTALSVKYFRQYRDDALRLILEHRLAKWDLAAARAVAEQVDNPSRQAAAILTVAAAFSRSGDQTTADKLAGGIELTEKYDLLPKDRRKRFDYRDARTWGVQYEARSFSTMMSIHCWQRDAAAVAAAAMKLAQAQRAVPVKPYEEQFNDVDEEVARALARSHAAGGDPGAALAWARRIGSGNQIEKQDDWQATCAVERRVHALVGVAEGMLDRSHRGPKPQR